MDSVPVARSLVNKTLGNSLQPVVKYFRPNAYNYWHPDLPVCEASLQDRSRYYLDFSMKAAFDGPFDDSGIPLTDYGGKVGRQYYPINIAQFGLGHAEVWSTTRVESSRDAFLRVAEWHLETLEVHGEAGLWPTQFDWLGIPAPWPSGMAQGQGISLLVRAYYETRSERFLDSAASAAKALELDRSQGGMTWTLEDGGLFFEEAPMTPPSSVLNGHIFTLWGLLDLQRAGLDTGTELLERGLQGLKTLLPRFDVGFWSRYDLVAGRLPNLASAFYHELHVRQLDVLFRLTQEPVFLSFKDRWEAQARSFPRRLLALGLKTVHKLFKY